MDYVEQARRYLGIAAGTAGRALLAAAAGLAPPGPGQDDPAAGTATRLLEELAGISAAVTETGTGITHELTRIHHELSDLRRDAGAHL